jgi:hypothetical protein
MSQMLAFVLPRASVAPINSQIPLQDPTLEHLIHVVFNWVKRLQSSSRAISLGFSDSMAL